MISALRPPRPTPAPLWESIQAMFHEAHTIVVVRKALAVLDEEAREALGVAR